jgi:hypothetical protein
MRRTAGADSGRQRSARYLGRDHVPPVDDDGDLCGGRGETGPISRAEPRTRGICRSNTRTICRSWIGRDDSFEPESEDRFPIIFCRSSIGWGRAVTAGSRWHDTSAAGSSAPWDVAIRWRRRHCAWADAGFKGSAPRGPLFSDGIFGASRIARPLLLPLSIALRPAVLGNAGRGS